MNQPTIYPATAIQTRGTRQSSIALLFSSVKALGSLFEHKMRHALAAIALVVLTGAVSAATIQGRVVGVSDGDTITVLDASKTQHKIRLTGIDAPEKDQPFGQRSKQHLSDLVFGQQVIVDSAKTDRYGRSLGKVLVNGVDANLEQIKAGFAWHYKQYEKEQPMGDRERYSRAETAARSTGIGLWRDAMPTPPWLWRRQ